MNLETLKKANELNVQIQDRIKYGEGLQRTKDNQDKEEKLNYLRITIQYGNDNATTLKDIDEMDFLETQIARNETQIKKLQKEFENLK